MAKSSLDGIMDSVGNLFDKLPVLPKDVKDVIVNITPWVALIFGVLGVLGALAGFGVLSVFSPLAVMGGGAGALGSGMVAVVLWLVSSALLLAAFPGTRKQKVQGWNYLFYSETVSLIANVISFNLGGILIALVAYYLLYQIRSYYK